MRAAGILKAEQGRWRSTVRWASLRDHLCVHSAYPTDEDNAVFFGPDTYRFARLIDAYFQSESTSAETLGRVADIGCGSGAGSILLASWIPAAQILAVDVNPHALQLTAVNAQLAGATRLEPLRSNLLDDVTGNFDLIVANPPYMLDDQERVYRHGGGDLGEGLSKGIVVTALDRLTVGGTLLLYTGVAIVDGRDPLRAELETLLAQQACRWTYEEVDPDVFSEELLKKAYNSVERIAAVFLRLTRLR